MTDIVGKFLTTFQVATDGSEFRLNLVDGDGRPVAVTLPADCLKELLLTLPRIVDQTLQARYQDDTVRVAYPLDRWRVERAEDGHLIVTLGTEDGFEVSFAVLASDLERIAAAANRGGEPHGDCCQRMH